jgi:hypothetical protein
LRYTVKRSPLPIRGRKIFSICARDARQIFSVTVEELSKPFKVFQVYSFRIIIVMNTRVIEADKVFS